MNDVKTAGYVIMAENDLKEVMYLGTDRDSGGYHYWSATIKSAEIFEDESAVFKVLESEEFTRVAKMSDETVRPPRMLDTGANLSNKHPKGSVRITAVPVLLGVPTWDKLFSVNIGKK